MGIELSALLRDSAYKLTQFNPEHIAALEATITLKTSKGGEVAYVTCLKRGKDIRLNPEEIVRQLYLYSLTQEYGYPLDRIEVEFGVHFGREVKRADIVVMDKDRSTIPYIIVELKKPKLKDGKEQLKSYCNATGAPIGVWTNGEQISWYHRKDPNYFEDITELPHATQKLSDIINEQFTIDDLIKHDKLVNEKKSLKTLILEMEDEVLANAGVDVFEELFKLIFTKLYDEWLGGRDRKRHLQFRNSGDTEAELRNKIQRLFDKAQEQWEGVFPNGAVLNLTPSHLSICVSSLQNVKLFNSNLDVVDEAFEYLINQSSKGEKGQYFTPRYVIDLCVKMLNPQEDETMIDTAAGSAGFTMHAIFHVWRQILAEQGINQRLPRIWLRCPYGEPSVCRRNQRWGTYPPLFHRPKGEWEITDDYDNALCSTGFYVVRSNTINPETLLVLFKSEAYQNLFKQVCTGTILTAMPKEFFGRIPVPVIEDAVQQTIAEKVRASFVARRQSQQLLEIAKQTIECAIESSEAEALGWLQAQLHQSDFNADGVSFAISS